MNEAVALGSFVGSAIRSLSIAIHTPPWLQGGVTSCLGQRSDLFFPDDYGLQHHTQIEEAKRVCVSCPVQDLCLEWAVPQPNLDGIWGGTTPPERRRIRTRKDTR